MIATFLGSNRKNENRPPIVYKHIALSITTDETLQMMKSNKHNMQNPGSTAMYPTINPTCRRERTGMAMSNSQLEKNQIQIVAVYIAIIQMLVIRNYMNYVLFYGILERICNLKWPLNKNDKWNSRNGDS